jgi:hypothetical protein
VRASYPESKAQAPHYTVTCGLSGSTKFFYIISQTAHKMFQFSLQFLSETFIILKRNPRDIVMNVKPSSCKVPVISVTFKWNWTFWAGFLSARTADFYQNLSSGSRVVPSGRTDMTKLISFSNFAKGPKNVLLQQSNLYFSSAFLLLYGSKND